MSTDEAMSDGFAAKTTPPGGGVFLRGFSAGA